MSVRTALKNSKSFHENYGTVGETSSTEESVVEIDANDGTPTAGELALEESAAGGLGRHLGLFSTTFLMHVPHAAPLGLLKANFVSSTASAG